MDRYDLCFKRLAAKQEGRLSPSSPSATRRPNCRYRLSMRWWRAVPMPLSWVFPFLTRWQMAPPSRVRICAPLLPG